jgi:hypothetical protein
MTQTHPQNRSLGSARVRNYAANGVSSPPWNGQQIPLSSFAISAIEIELGK